jgi:magnesium transporter
MIRTILSNETYRARHPRNLASPPEVLLDGHNLLWLDLEAPTPEEMRQVAGEFGFHPLAVEDATLEHARAKIDHYDTFHFLTVFDVYYSEFGNRILVRELDVFFGADYLVTVHQEPIEGIGEVVRRLRENLVTIERGVGVLLYSLLDTIVDHYFPVIDHVRHHIQELEDRVFELPPHPKYHAALRADIFAFRTVLLEWRLVIGPQRDVVAVLTRHELPLITRKTAVYFKDVADHLQGIIETVDISRELLQGVLDSYHARNADGLNQSIRVMTSFSIILMSVTLVSSIYGMNFDTEASPFNMPELDNYFGYPLALLFMGMLGAGLVFLLRRRGWL